MATTKRTATISDCDSKNESGSQCQRPKGHKGLHKTFHFGYVDQQWRSTRGRGSRGPYKPRQAKEAAACDKGRCTENAISFTDGGKFCGLHMARPDDAVTAAKVEGGEAVWWDYDPSDEDGPPEGVDLSLPGEAEYDEAMRRDRDDGRCRNCDKPLGEDGCENYDGLCGACQAAAEDVALTPEQARELLDWIFSEEAQGVRLDDPERLHVFAPGEIGPMAGAKRDGAGRWEVRR